MKEPIHDWRSLADHEIEAHFNPRLAVADADQHLGSWAERSARLEDRHGCRRDVRYGDGPKATYDYYRTAADAPTVVFIHGGYWRRLDKSDHVFAADGLVRAGMNVVNLNYDLCPDVSLTELNRRIAAGIRHVTAEAGQPIHLMGHSAGGHAAAMAAADRLLAPSIAGIVAVSGVYDTRAVLRTSINEDVRMTAEEAERLNALGMAPAGRHIRILCTVGGHEPAAWIGQSAAYHAMASDHVDDCRLDVVPDTNHFTVLEACCDPDHPAGRRVAAFVRGK